jgi:DNA-directed RNA polymerase subunit M/transcription elongation factor TFIIS
MINQYFDENNYRNRFLCKSCKKMLITKEALDNHIINCYECKIEKIIESHKKEKEKLINEYEQKIEEITDYMLKHVDAIEKKHINLNNELLCQLKKMAKLSACSD